MTKQNKPLSHSEETKKKMSKSHTGKKMSLEARKKVSLARKGVSQKHEGQFKNGHTPWNKRGIEYQDTKRVRKNGKILPISHCIYMEYHNLEEIPKGFVIHHKDENPQNNDINNLRLMRKEDHNFLHQCLDKERYKFKKAVRELQERVMTWGGSKRNPNYVIGVSSMIKLIDEIFGEELCNGQSEQTKKGSADGKVNNSSDMAGGSTSEAERVSPNKTAPSGKKGCGKRYVYGRIGDRRFYARCGDDGDLCRECREEADE